MSEASPDLELHARHQLHDRWLQLDYRATNRSAGPLFVFNILHGEFANGVYPLDRSAYVEVTEDRVTVSRKLFPVPPDMLVETRNIPFLTRLAPGETLSESVQLAVPLAPRNPYAALDAAKARVGERELVVELGYFRGAPGTERLGVTFQTDAGPRPGFEVFGENAQKLARTGPLGPVSVLIDGAPHG